MAEKLLLADDTRIDNWGENVDSEMPPWDEKTDGRDEVQTSAEEIVLEDQEVIRGDAHTDILEDHDMVRGDALTDILEDQEMGEAHTVTLESTGVLAVHQIQVKICWFSSIKTLSN
jgi:hypothetical protein